MASSAVHLDGGAAGSSPTGFVTASASPTTNRLQLLTIAIARGSSTQPTAPSSVTGCGLTWVQVGTTIDYDTVGSTRASVFLYRALGTASAGSVTVTFGYTAQNYAYEWDEVPDVVQTGTNGSGAVSQVAQTTGSGTTPSATLGAFSSTNNNTYGALGQQITASSITEGAGFTLLGKNSFTATVNVCSLSEHKNENDTTVDVTGSTLSWGLYALEIASTALAGAITGKGANAAAGRAPLLTSLTLTGRGTAAAAGRGSLQLTGLDALTGRAGNASAGRAALTVSGIKTLTGRGAAASAGRLGFVIINGGIGGDLTTYTTSDIELLGSFTEFVATNVSWEEQLSEAGGGQVVIQNDLPQPAPGDLITMAIQGQPVWTMICESFTKKTADQNEEAAHQTVWEGRGHLALWARAVTYPTLGLDSVPKQHDLVFDWTHYYYDDSWWVTANPVSTVGTAKTVWGGAPPGPFWAVDYPDDTAQVLAAPGDDALTDADIGTRYFRQFVDVPASDRSFLLYFGGDNTFSLWIDGCQIIDNNSGNPSSYAGAQFVEVPLTEATHLFAWSVTNFPPLPGVANPTGGAWTLYNPTSALPTLVANSGSSAVTMVGPVEVAPDSSSYPPGMSPGNAIRLWLEAAQFRGDLGDWTLSFNDDTDSAGVAWVTGNPSGRPDARISTKILTDGLTFLREVSATYIDMRARATSYTLDAYNFGTMALVDSGEDFLPEGNDQSLQQKGQFQLANVLIGEFNDEYLSTQDDASIALYGRIEGRLAIGAVNGQDEAQRVLDQALPLYAYPREEISVEVDGPVGYLDYDLGQTADTIDSTGAAISERITAIAVTVDPNGRVLTRPTLKDLFI